jgi:UDP-arabinose 4-epimerase
LNILVTGGAGFIGSHTCKILSRNGHVPVTYDNLSRGHTKAVKWGPLEVGELADTARLRAVMAHYQVGALIHFAAYAYVGESTENPLLYYYNNVCGSVALFQALLQYKPVPVVFSSTCATYGMPDQTLITEDHPQRPINPYGFTKLAVERMLTDLGSAHQLPWVSLRYFNAAGSDPENEIGEDHDPETHLIPLVLRAARTNTPLRIYGTDYDTPDGTCVRDYVHVMDIADAHIRALQYLMNGGQSCALNLANSRGYSIKDVIATAARICGCDIPTTAAPRRLGDPPILIGSAERARMVLEWQPKFSDLTKQMQDAWNWLNQHK